MHEELIFVAGGLQILLWVYGPGGMDNFNPTVATPTPEIIDWLLATFMGES